MNPPYLNFIQLIRYLFTSYKKVFEKLNKKVIIADSFNNSKEIESLKNNYILGCGIAIIISLIGILLSFNWLKLLDSYGTLNGAKIRVITEIEKKLPVNIYDTEWKVMSEKLGSKNYVSFTNIEKRIPKIFIGIYLFIICFAIILGIGIIL